MIIEEQNKIKLSLFNKISEWWNKHWLEIAVFCIVLLIVTLVIGLWRLKKTTPEKQPIKFERIENF